MSRVTLAAVFTVCLVSTIACSPPGNRSADASGPDSAAPTGGPGGAPAGQSAVERGKYLTSVLGCHDCHTPLKMTPSGPMPDQARALSGHPAELIMPPPPVLPEGPWMWIGAGTNTAFAGPWGISYAPNLTPDESTGIGSWTEEIFVNAIRTGKHWGQSRPILPPMPWQTYANLTDDDLKAVYAYLHSLAPISNQAPETVPAEPHPPSG